MIKELIKFDIKNMQSLNEREKSINTQIQKAIDVYNSNGFIVLEHKVVNKTNTHASVNFTLKKMVRV
jgi:hypothetical protein